MMSVIIVIPWKIHQNAIKCGLGTSVLKVTSCMPAHTHVQLPEACSTMPCIHLVTLLGLEKVNLHSQQVHMNHSIIQGLAPLPHGIRLSHMNSSFARGPRVIPALYGWAAECDRVTTRSIRKHSGVINYTAVDRVWVDHTYRRSLLHPWANWMHVTLIIADQTSRTDTRLLRTHRSYRLRVSHAALILWSFTSLPAAPLGPGWTGWPSCGRQAWLTRLSPTRAFSCGSRLWPEAIRAGRSELTVFQFHFKSKLIGNKWMSIHY